MNVQTNEWQYILRVVLILLDLTFAPIEMYQLLENRR